MKPKSKNKNSFKNQQWKSEPIPGDFFSCKEFENLISFEVLTDYDLVQVKNDVDNDGGADEGEDFNNEVEVEEQATTGSKSARKRKGVDEKSSDPVTKKIKRGEQKVKRSNSSSGSSTGNTTVESTTAWEVYDTNDTSDDEASESDENDKIVPSKEMKPIRDNAEGPKAKEKAKVKSNRSDKKRVAELVEHKEAPEPVAVPKLTSKTFNLQEWSKLGLPDFILKALEEKGFDDPTPIQKLTLGATVLGKKDCVGAAETGSGKTLAFVIPIILGIHRERSKLEESREEGGEDGLKALILTPTRELAVQIKRHIDAVATYSNINTVVIVGGLAAQKQERLLKLQPDIVIATPGRLWELVQDGTEHLSNLHKIKFLAVDETDRMVEKGHFQELQGILSALNMDADTMAERQNFVFSATLAFTHEPPQRLKSANPKKKKAQVKKVDPREKLQDIMTMIGVKDNAKIVDITSGKGTCETLVEMSITCTLSQKDYYLYYFFVKHPGRTIVFCNSINCVRRLVNLFFFLQCEPLALHSEMHQKQRLRNLERFTENDKAILISTDVAARGLDIVNIDHVIHYQVPKTAESYIHRSGRTARAFKGGLALVLVEPAETAMLKDISRSLGRTEMLPSFPIDGKFFSEIKARVDLAIKVEQFEHTVRKKCADTNWIEKAKKEMDLATSDEDSDRDIGGKQEQKKNIKEAKQKLEVAKAQLARMLAMNFRVLRSTNKTSPAAPKVDSQK